MLTTFTSIGILFFIQIIRTNPDDGFFFCKDWVSCCCLMGRVSVFVGPGGSSLFVPWIPLLIGPYVEDSLLVDGASFAAFSPDVGVGCMSDVK